MVFLRMALLVGVTTLTIGLAAFTSAQAQAPGDVPSTYDGATFYNQTPETQALFTATWGPRAAEVWANQHNAELLAAGYPIPQSQIVAQPIQDQSGAQISDDDNENESNDEDNDNDNDSNDNDEDNDNE